MSLAWSPEQVLHQTSVPASQSSHFFADCKEHTASSPGQLLLQLNDCCRLFVERILEIDRLCHHHAVCPKLNYSKLHPDCLMLIPW